MSIAIRNRNAADLLLGLKNPGTEYAVYDHIGRAIEAALLAIVARQKRYNTWPTRAQAPELHGHRLRKIARFANVAPPGGRKDLRPKFQTVLEWDPNRRYSVGPMSFEQVREIYEAGLGAQGVFAWLRTI